MPIVKCPGGHKWGRHGHCYKGKGSAKKAGKQAAAAYAHGYKGAARPRTVKKYRKK